MGMTMVPLLMSEGSWDRRQKEVPAPCFPVSRSKRKGSEVKCGIVRRAGISLHFALSFWAGHPAGSPVGVLKGAEPQTSNLTTSSSAFLSFRNIKLVPTSGPLHLRLFLSGMFFPFLFAGLAPAYPSGLKSKAISSERLSLATPSKIAHRPLCDTSLQVKLSC